jgi:cytochrome subunit of sulfide dehydrogenase
VAGWRTLWLVMFAASYSEGWVAADERPGDALAAACTSCHGVDGRSSSAIPPLAGRDAADIALVLQAFRSGERKGTIMGRIARGYTDQQIQDLAASVGLRRQ